MKKSKVGFNQQIFTESMVEFMDDVSGSITPSDSYRLSLSIPS